MTNMKPERRVPKSKVENKNAPRKDNGEENYFNFHQRIGHRLKDCKAFENESPTHRIYTILDDQSNASIVSPNLVSKLDVNGPSLKYLLSTCSAGKEERSGQRISGISVRSMDGRRSKLNRLIECADIPQDKQEIATPEVAKKFPHLREIAEEIPRYDPEAAVEILIGRDAPELLKDRANRN